MNPWTLAKKDLLIYFRDRAGVLLGIGLPIVLVVIFGAAMGTLGGNDSTIGRIKLYVEDRDGTEASRDFVATLAQADGLRLVTLDPAEIDAGETESARAKVADGDGPAGLLIEAGFADQRAAGGLEGLVLFRDPAKSIEQQILAGNLMPALFQAAGDELGRGVLLKSLDLFDFPAVGRDRARAILDTSWDDMGALVDSLGGWQAEASPAAGGGDEEEGEPAAGSSAGFDFGSLLTDALGLEVEDVVGGDDAAAAQRSGGQAHAVAGMAVMMLLFGLIACGGTLLDEEEQGTLDRLRLAPGAGRVILGGKFLFTWIIGLLQLGILFGFAGVFPIFDIPVLRDPLALGVHSMAVASAATGFGVLFAVACRSRKQLEGISTMVVLAMSALGGSWWPLAITPEWFQKLGHFTLTAWAMDGYQGIFWYEKSLVEILPEIGVLLGIAAVTSALAAILWRRRVRV